MLLNVCDIWYEYMLIYHKAISQVFLLFYIHHTDVSIFWKSVDDCLMKSRITLCEHDWEVRSERKDYLRDEMRWQQRCSQYQIILHRFFHLPHFLFESIILCQSSWGHDTSTYFFSLFINFCLFLSTYIYIYIYTISELIFYFSFSLFYSHIDIIWLFAGFFSYFFRVLYSFMQGIRRFFHISYFFDKKRF